MFNNYKAGFTLLAAGIITTMVGCQKEEEPLDLEVPTLTLEISGNPAKLYNETTLRSSANDNDTISRVVFYVNNDSIGQATERPYELIWNTKEVEDGPYTLKAAAYDASGNKAEAAQEVTVKNTLFVVHVESNFLQPRENEKEDQWVFLSDKNGNVIGEAKQVVNGERLSWERPSHFYADTVYLNRLYYYSWDPQYSETTYDNISVYTYTNFTIEETNLKGYTYPDSVGNADIRVENDFNGIDGYEYATDLPFYSSSAYSSSNTVTYSVNLQESNQKGFSTYEKRIDEANQSLREKYYRLDELSVGNSYVFHSNEYTAMEGQTVSFPFSFDYAGVSIQGFLNDKQETGYSLDWNYLWDGQTQDLKTFYTDAFPLIRSNVSVSTGSKNFYLSKMGKAPEIVSVPDYAVSVESDKLKNVLVTSSHGSFDVASSSWSYKEESENLSVTARRIVYFGNKSGANYILPEIPAALLTLYPVLNNQMEYNWVWMLDNKHLSSYNEVMDLWFTNTYTSNEYRDFSGLYLYPESAGGRILSNQKEKPDQKEMEKEDLRARGILTH